MRKNMFSPDSMVRTFLWFPRQSGGQQDPPRHKRNLTKSLIALSNPRQKNTPVIGGYKIQTYASVSNPTTITPNKFLEVYAKMDILL